MPVRRLVAAGANSGTIPPSDNPTVPAVGLVPDGQRHFTIWNGTITNVDLGGASDVAGEQQSLTVTFTAASDTVVIAWGGHVADEITWPHATAAGSINGSPYHMRVLSLDGDSSGHQDRSMKTDLTSPRSSPMSRRATVRLRDSGGRLGERQRDAERRQRPGQRDRLLLRVLRSVRHS
jgi:hypothetical protein